MQALARMSAGRKLIMLVGDKGYTKISEMRGTLKNPHLARHGSFSAMVNFHALQLFVDQLSSMSVARGEEKNGADSSSKNGAHSSSSTRNAFIRVSPFGEGFKTALIGLGMSKQSVPLTSWSFHESAESKSADQLSSLQRSESEQSSTATIQRALGLLRLCNYDSDVFMKFKHIFIRAVGDPETSKSIRDDLSRLTKLILSRYYHLNETKDIWFELGRINMGLGDYQQAHVLFEISNRQCGAHHVTHHNIGICCYFIDNLKKAIVSFDASLSMKSNYSEAIKWRLKTVEKMAADAKV